MKEITCIVCPKSCHIEVYQNYGEYNVKGSGCKRGADFAVQEAVNPQRSLTTTINTIFEDQPLLPVKTDRDIPLDRLFDVMTEINKLLLNHEVNMGEVLISNILGTGANIVSTGYIANNRQ